MSNIVRWLANRLTLTLLCLFFLLLFSSQIFFYDIASPETGPLFFPIVFLFVVLSILVFAVVFRDKPLAGSLAAAAASVLFVCGEVCADTGIGAMVFGPIAWWNETVVVGSILFGVPAAVIAAVCSYFLARYLSGRRLDIDR
jgi:hypothetical protein